MIASASPLTSLTDPSLLRSAGFINGDWIQHFSSFAVHDPSNGRTIAHVANLGATEAATAVQSAHVAWLQWRNTTAKYRASVLRRWFTLIHEHADDLATILTSEQGKPLAEAKAEVGYAASFVEWFAEEAKRVYGETVPTTDVSKRYLVLKQSVGVCAAITPWNFPLAMITRKVAPALAAGCTIVVKPAEQTPLSALALAELGARAGIPPGVLNVVTADRNNSVAVGSFLCETRHVRHVSFTGSTAVGRLLMKLCASTIKKLSLELGGNAPFIVFDDADLPRAVEGAINSKFRNSGQTCVCANRLLVQSGVYDRFISMLSERVSAMKVGNGFDEQVHLGPLIDEDALLKVEQHISDAVENGASLVTGGKRAGRYHFQPTVLAGATSDMLCAREEIFGPVAPVFRFESEEDAIKLANDTEYGLASYVYTRDIGRVWRLSEALEYGMVGVNTGLISTAEVPFGGVKQSGMGREGARQGLEDYLEVKYVCLGDVDR